MTDLASDQARELVTKLLIFDQAVTDFVPDRNAHTPPLRAIVFARRRDFLAVSAKRHFAAFAHAGLNAITLVIGPGRANRFEELERNALHEYTHYLLRTQNLAFPAWYDEGLANVLERSQINIANGQVTHGAYQVDPSFVLHRRDLRQILAQRPKQNFLPRYYTLSGLLTHFLLFGADDYQTLLPAHFAQRSQHLTQTLDLSERSLLRALDRHRRTMASRRLTLQHHEHQFTISEKPMAPAAIPRLLALMSEIMYPKGAAARYQALLAQQPHDAELWTGLSRSYIEINLDKAAQALAEAVALNPDHHEVQIQQAVLQTETCPLDTTSRCRPQWEAAATTLRQVLAADPGNFDAAYRLGVTELYSGRADKALGYLRLAHQLAPWSPRINLHLGDCLRILGARSARDHLLNARAWAQDKATYYLADAALDLIATSAAPDP